MKKLISLALVCVMLLSVMSAFAAPDASKLPFALSAPANVSVRWLEENDSPTTMRFSLSLANDMTAFYKDLENANRDGTAEDFMSKYDYGEIWTIVQIDWALDDVNDEVSGWHYTKYWDAGVNGIKYDENWNIRTSEWDAVDYGLDNATETVQDYWIMRSTPDDERWNGNPDTKTPGVKDQLRPDQYEYYDDSVHIDFTKHTAYFRARLVTITRKDTDEGIKDEYYFSDWSETVGYGKDAAKVEALKPGDIDAPVITGLRKTGEMFNDNPVVAFTLTVPEKLQQQATEVAAAGGSINIWVECRVKGDAEWTNMPNSDHTIKSGEMECALLHLVNDERPTIPEDTEIELRCIYCCSQPGEDDFNSAYSNVIAFGTDDINAGKTNITDGTGDGSGSKSECWLCHFCPQPLGLCIFIWLLIIIIVIVVVIIIVVNSKKKKDQNK